MAIKDMKRVRKKGRGCQEINKRMNENNVTKKVGRKIRD